MTLTTRRLTPPYLGRHSRALLVLGVPLVGSHLAQFAISLTDTLMLGWYGVEELAALVLAGACFFIFFIVGSGFAWAVMPMVASYVSAGDDQQVRRVTRMGLWLSILYGLVVTPALLFSETIFLVIGQDPELSRLAGQYLSIVVIGFIPNLLIMVLKSYLAALERTQVVFWITVSTALLNAALNYALIFGNWGFPELGVRGAAIASVILQVVGFLALVVYVSIATPQYALFQRFWRPDWEAFGQVFRLGWPIGLTNLAEMGLFTASTIMVGWIGKLELAAHGIALNISSATFMVHVGLSQAATIRVGQYYGRRERMLIRETAVTAYTLSALVAGATILVFLILPEPLIGAFVDSNDIDRPAIIAIGVALLAVAAVFQLVDAAQVMSLSMLRGIQDTGVPMIHAAISYWLVGAPAAYFAAFKMGLGAVGVWLGLVVGLGCAGVLLSLRFWRRSGEI
jgi:MATE family multidrug resistance protein